MEETLSIQNTEKKSWLHRIPPEAWIFIFYFLVAVFLTWPLIIKFGSSIYGVRSDNMGALWQFWWMRNYHHFSASYSSCPLIGFPFGARFFGMPMEPIGFYLEYFLLLFFNEVVVYNLITLSSFVLSGITMYYLVRHLTGDRQVAFFGGFAYLISTNLAINAMFFLNLAMVEWMPLYILMLLRFIKKPDWKSALWLTISALLVAGTNVHYALFMGIFTIAFLAGRLVAKRFSLRREARRQGQSGRIPWEFNKRTLALSLLVLLVLIVVMTPFYVLPLSYMNPAGKWPTGTTPLQLRIEKYIEWNSASPREYILPGTDNPVLGKINKYFGQSRGSFSNSLYIGWSLIILAVIGVVFAIRRREKEKYSIDYLPDGTRDSQSLSVFSGSADENRYITWGLALAAIIAFLLSLKPYIHIGSTRIPMPSWLLLTFVPWFRWYMRISIVIVICVTILACFGLSRILDKLRKSYKAVLLISLTIIITVEMLIVPPFRKVDLSEVPRVFTKLAALPEDSAIAFYPAQETGLFITNTLMDYQRTFQRPMLNGAIDNSDGEALRRTVYNPFNDATPGILRRFNIEYFVYFGEQLLLPKDLQSAAKLPPGLELVKKFNEKGLFDNADLFRITAPKAQFVPLYLGYITVPRLDEGVITARLVFGDGIISILNFSGKDSKVALQLPITNNAIDREIIIKSGKKTLWQRKVTAGQEIMAEISDLAIPKKGIDLLLIVHGAPVKLKSNELVLFGTQLATIRIGDLKIKQL